MLFNLQQKRSRELKSILLDKLESICYNRDVRITKIETSVYSIPTRREISDAIHRLSAFETVIARVSADEGLEGIGWTYTLGAGGHAIQSLIDRALSPLVQGEDPQEVERLWDRMWRGTHYLGSSGLLSHAIAAVDIALWDLVGKARNQPLYRLVGGHRDRIPVYGSGINLNYTLEELVQEMQGFLRQGIKAVKMKVGKDDLQEDIRRIRAVRDAVGPDLLIMVDANQKWSVAEALYRSKALQEEGVYWLEEPLLADDHYGYQQLARTCPIPLAAGETHYTRYQFQGLFHRGAIGYVQADVCRVGGITEWLKIAHLAEAHNLPMAPHAREELHLQLCCGVSNGFIVEHLPVTGLNTSEVVLDPIIPINGYLHPSNKPGHGVEFDWTALEHYRVL